MKDVKITCDHCGADISTTGATPKYRLVLSYESLPFTENYRHAVMVHPPLEHEMHFCNTKCLASRFEKHLPAQKENKV